MIKAVIIGVMIIGLLFVAASKFDFFSEQPETQPSGEATTTEAKVETKPATSQPAVKEYQPSVTKQTYISPLTTSTIQSQPAARQITQTPQATTSPYTGQITPYPVLPPSPYYKKIKISGVSYSSYGNNPTTIKLMANLQKEESVDITGWTIKSNKQNFVIPKAVGYYEWGVAQTDSDIVLKASHSVNIYSNTSAVGKNLRMNKCIGYLENTFDFNPALPQNCPSPLLRTDYTHLSGQCQSYLLTLTGCKEVSTSIYNSFPGTDEGNACRAFLNSISANYSGCYNKHRWDTDFLSNEWRVWVNQNILDSQHDRIRLFDINGQLVDEYYY